MVTFHSRDVWERKPVSMWNMCAPVRGRGIWFINQWQGGKERCVGLVTTVRLKWCILLFFILSLPRRSYYWLICFLSGAAWSLKHPEGQHVPVSCRPAIPGDALCTRVCQGLQGTCLEAWRKAAQAECCVLPTTFGLVVSLQLVDAAVNRTQRNLKISYLCWEYFH